MTGYPVLIQPVGAMTLERHLFPAYQIDFTYRSNRPREEKNLWSKPD